MMWRTMESAPRNGTRVLVLAMVPGSQGWEGPRMVIARWDGYDWYDGHDNVKPTHWQPLPSTDLTAPCPVVETRNDAADTRDFYASKLERIRTRMREHYAGSRTTREVCHEIIDIIDERPPIAELREGKR
jgi:hypothetical protein